MSSRKKSTSTEESSSGSTSDSTSSSGTTSGSDSGSSSSDTDSSSSPDEKTARSSSRSNDPPNSSNNVVPTKSANSNANDKNARRRSSDTKQQPKIEEKPNINSSKTKTAASRGQRLSKSSIYSSDEDNLPSKKQPVKNPQPTDRKKITEARKTSTTCLPQNPITGGGKAPPAVVKQHQQQNMGKQAANRQATAKVAPKSRAQLEKNKEKSIFSPVNSSESDDGNDKKQISKNSTVSSTTGTTSKVKPPPKGKAKVLQQKKVTSNTARKKEDTKSSVSSGSSSSSDGSSSSSGSDDSDSSDEDSSPPSKKPATQKLATKKSSSNNKSSDGGKTVILSDSETETNGKLPAIRKLTRSSSTRKSKHLTGKTTDSESEAENDTTSEKRSVSKSPVKKAPVIATKSKTTKTKRETTKATTPLPLSTPPIPEEQKCPVEGCDSSGHLCGNLDTHFLPEACPIYHNMSASEAKERANERRVRDDERKKAIASYDVSKKVLTPEQKAYQMKIREWRAKFKPLQGAAAGEKIKIEKNINDNEREPNLIGLVPDYDLQLFREAQAIASEKMEDEIKDLPVGKGTKYITMGKHQMKVWYQSPYPDDVARQPKMYICEFCLRYQKSEVGMKRHSAKCVWRHPPGDEIYRKAKLQVWQVDGKRHKQYCQYLCLLAKFFLDHKTLYYDVEPFLFYVMTLADSDGCHTVGYFSKEKNSFLNYNVSCILTLPPYQRKGYGRLLIDFSYLLTRVEGKIGSPEKPLSDLGLISYRSYWKDVLLDYLCTRTGTTLSIKDVSQEMAIYSYDIVSTLQALGMMKYWKGKHIILKKQDVLEEFEERVKRRGNFPKIDPACLRWSPFIPPQPSGSS